MFFIDLFLQGITTVLSVVEFFSLPFLNIMPPRVENFIPRRLLTHRCYSNSGRKSGLNITFDLTCQLIHRYLF